MKPGFVQLPKYLGGALLGSEQELLNLGVDRVLAVLARITNNVDTEWTDTDRGLVDKPCRR